MVCYHYDDIDKDKSIEDREKIVTHRFDEIFEIKEWIDQSPPSSTIDYLE